MLPLLVRLALPRLYSSSSSTGKTRALMSTWKPPQQPQQQAGGAKKKLPGMLSDPATYPLIGIVGSAMTLATGFIVYFTLKSPDVRLNKKERNRLARELKHSNEVTGFDAPFEKA